MLYRLLRGSGTAGLAGDSAGGRAAGFGHCIDCTREEVREYLLRFVFRGAKMPPTRTRRIARNTSVTRSCRCSPEAVVDRFLPEQPNWRERKRHTGRRKSTGWRAGILSRKAKAVLINADDLSRLPVAVQRRLLRRAVQEVKGDLAGNRSVSCRCAAPSGRRKGKGMAGTRLLGSMCSDRSNGFVSQNHERKADAERDYCLGLAVPGITPHSRSGVNSLCRSC